MPAALVELLLEIAHAAKNPDGGIVPLGGINPRVNGGFFLEVKDAP